MLNKIKKFFKGFLATTLSASTTVSGVATLAATQVRADNEYVLSVENVGAGRSMVWNGSNRVRRHETALFTLTRGSQSLHVFCTQPFVGTGSGTTYSSTSSVINDWDTNSKNLAKAAASWYMYNGSGKYGSTYSVAKRVATQWYVWELAVKNGGGCSSFDGEGNCNGSGETWSDFYYDHDSGYEVANDQALFEQAWNEYQTLKTYITTSATKPRFQCISGCTKDASGKYIANPGTDIVFNDANGVFHDSSYELVPSSNTGITYEKRNDALIVHIASNFNGTFDGHIDIEKQYLSLRNTIGKNVASFVEFTSGSNAQALWNPEYSFTDPEDYGIDLKVTQGKITVTKADSIYGDNLSGATFEVYNSEGTKVDTITTGDDGTGTSIWLPYGTYTIKETAAPVGYNNDNTTEVSVTVDAESVTKDFTDKIIQGTVSIVKSDSTTNQKLEGAIFSIYKTAGVSGVAYTTPIYIGDMPATDANGYALSGLLDYGDYYLVEKTAAYGYYNARTQYPFQIREERVNIPLTATNERQELQINVLKLDKNDDGFGVDNEGNKLKLAGAEFGLYQHVILRDSVTGVKYYEDDVLIETAVSDENGIAKFELQTAYSSTLQFDSYYYVKELKAPAGYILDDTPQRLTYEYGDQFNKYVVVNQTYEDVIKKAPITVYKQDKETGEYLAGAVFEIKNSNGVVVDTITTTAEGKAVSKDLRPGTYTVTEITAPDHYQLMNVTNWEGDTEGSNTKTVEIKVVADSENPDIYNVVGVETEFANLHDKGKLKIYKVDGLTVNYIDECDVNGENCVSVPELKDDTVYLPNVTFAVYNKNDLTTPITTLTTNAQGEAEVILNTGEYYLQEIQAPAGYNVNPSLMTVVLTNHGELVEKIMTNMTVYGEISIYKVGETLIGTSLDEESGITNLVYKNTYIAGVKFELRANEDIYHPLTGELLYEKDSLVREIETGSDGKVTVTNLPLGEYYVKEITAPEGHSVYDATSDVKYITLTEEDANFEGLIEEDLTFVNERLTIDPQIYKVGAHKVVDTDEETTYEYTPLPGAIFGVYNTEDIKYTDDEGNEKTIVAGTLLGTMETDDKGFADTEIKIPFGKYYVQEIKAPEGYHINEEQYPFELVWKQELQENNVIPVEVVSVDEPIINYEIEIPKTGVNSSFYTMVGVVTIAIAGAAIVISKKRKVEE